MNARIFTSIQDVVAAIGEPVGPTGWLRIDEPRVRAFAEATEDRQWIHVDPDRAAEGPFGALIAHGYLTLALIPFFAGELAEFRMNGMRLNYGLNRVRFPAAVRVGERVRCRADIVSVEQHELGHLLTTDYTIEIDGGDKPACVAQSLSLLVTAS